MSERKKKNTLADVISRLDVLIQDNAILKENAKESAKENAILREQNCQLAARVESLEHNLLPKRAPLISSSTNTDVSYSSDVPTATETATSAVCPASPTPSTPTSSASPPKICYQALVLSDSIFRHVAGECPKKRHPPETCVKYGVPRMPEKIEKDLDFAVACPDAKEYVPNPQQHPPLAIKKVVIPGADCDRLFCEASSLASVYQFEHVYVHVGTNLRDKLTVEETITEICDFLASIKKLFDCQVTYSPILPRLLRSDQSTDPSADLLAPLSEPGRYLINCIRRINAGTYKFCHEHGIGLLLCAAFEMDWEDPIPDRLLLAKDGCHLSRKGVEEMQFTLFEHIMSTFWRWHGNTF